MLYTMHTNSKPAVGKTGKKILRAAKKATPIRNKAADNTIALIVTSRKAKKTNASQAKVC
jgi:hypothetical protein